MLSVLGDDYIAQHVYTEMYNRAQEAVFRTYVTDALMAISTQNQKMTKRYADIVKGVFERPKEKESATEIKSRFLSGLNKLLGKEGEKANGT